MRRNSSVRSEPLTMNQIAIAERLREASRDYPAKLVESQLTDVPRISFNIDLVLSRQGSGARVCDLGGGIGVFSVGCAAVGLRSVLVDDFRDDVNDRFASLPRTL